MGVRVVDEAVVAECNEADYVRVSTWCDPEQDTVTLATIQRVVHRRLEDAPSTIRERVKTLLSEQPMSPDDALGLARSYAERKRIPLILSAARIADHTPPLEETGVEPSR